MVRICSNFVLLKPLYPAVCAPLTSPNPLKTYLLGFTVDKKQMRHLPQASGVTSGLSQRVKTYLKGTHWLP